MPALDDEIARLYTQERMTISAISAVVFLSETGVRNALIRKGVPRRRRGGTYHFLPQPEVQRTADLYLRGGPGGLGMSTYEVGRALGRHESSVRDRLMQAGVTRRTREEWETLMDARRALGSDA